MRNRASEVWSFGPSRNDGVSDCFASARNCECCEAAESKIAAVLLRSNELLRSNSIHTPDVIATSNQTSTESKPQTNIHNCITKLPSYRPSLQNGRAS